MSGLRISETLNSTVLNLLKLQTPLPSDVASRRANCFNAVLLYFARSSAPDFTGPEEFVRDIATHFEQVPTSDSSCRGDVVIVWSRSSDLLRQGRIWIDDLLLKKPGYPFGLVIEHAFVSLGEGRVFQKRDPSPLGPYEIVSEREALAPYLTARGFEITRHR